MVERRPLFQTGSHSLRRNAVLFRPSGAVVDLHEQLRLGQAAEDGDLRLKNPGAYVLVLQTDDRAQTHLPSIRFNDYVKVEGLTPAYRSQT
jgi:hypothetical protein